MMPDRDDTALGSVLSRLRAYNAFVRSRPGQVPPGSIDGSATRFDDITAKLRRIRRLAPFASVSAPVSALPSPAVVDARTQALLRCSSFPSAFRAPFGQPALQLAFDNGPCTTTRQHRFDAVERDIAFYEQKRDQQSVSMSLSAAEDEVAQLMQRVTLQPAVPADRELDEAIAVILDGIVGELVLERILTDSKTAAIDNLAYDVSRIWSAPRSHVHVMKFNQDMTTDILLCLRDGVWLNDEVMNFHISMMQERNQERLAAWPGSVPSVFFHNSFFYAKLAPDGQYRYANVARWTKRKRVDIFAVDLVMFPVHVGESHWCLGVIDMMNKQIAYYDSLGGDNRAFFANARRYVADEHADKKGSPLDTSVWTDVLPGSVPRQNNGCDCGVFTLKFADFLSDGLPLTFHQSDMPYFRRRCAKEITVGRLL